MLTSRKLGPSMRNSKKSFSLRVARCWPSINNGIPAAVAAARKCLLTVAKIHLGQFGFMLILSDSLTTINTTYAKKKTFLLFELVDSFDFIALVVKLDVVIIIKDKAFRQVFCVEY